MPNQFLVTCCLCVWLFSISAPAVFTLGMEDPALVASTAAGEEEPGEGETKDSPQELWALQGTRQLHFITRVAADRLPFIGRANRFQIIREVVLPPPEATLLPQSDL